MCTWSPAGQTNPSDLLWGLSWWHQEFCSQGPWRQNKRSHCRKTRIRFRVQLCPCRRWWFHKQMKSIKCWVSYLQATKIALWAGKRCPSTCMVTSVSMFRLRSRFKLSRTSPGWRVNWIQPFVAMAILSTWAKARTRHLIILLVLHIS